MKRADVLQTAQQYVCADRETQYGPPEDNFSVIANLWSVYLQRVAQNTGWKQITPHDVSVMMTLLKIGRIASGQTKDDNYIDAAGYLACAGEIATGASSLDPHDAEDALRAAAADALNPGEVCAVDFDGTLCENAYPEIGRPYEKYIEALKAASARGVKLILHTCREGGMLTLARYWCSERELYFDAVNENLPERIAQYGGDCKKISADYYHDDRAVGL